MGEENAVPLSGNPGYVLGLPVLAGNLVYGTDSGGNTRYSYITSLFQ